MENQPVVNPAGKFFAEQQYFNQTVIDNLFVFYGTLNKQGSLLGLSGRVFDRTNLSPGLLIGQKFSETVFWHSSDQTPKMLESAIAAAAKGMMSQTLLDFRLSSDDKLFVDLHLFPSENPETNEIFFCAYDVTNQEKQIDFHRQQSEQLLFAAESAKIGLWSWDLQNNAVYSTPKCNEILEIPPYQEIVYENFIEVVHPEDRAHVERVLELSQANGTEYHEKFRVVYNNGQIEWVSANGKTFLDNDGNPQKMMGVLCNITNQKKSEEDLERVYDREKKARDEAVEANRSKDFFLAFVSHELRSPLNAILGWSKILLTKEVDDSTRRNALETIERSARSQAKLISDLVDSARISSGKLRLEFRPTNLYDILESVYHSQKPAAEAKNIDLTIESESGEIPIVADSVRLQQVFNNLISNSLKFTPSGGSISINLKISANSAKVSVTDNGQGIKPELLPFIFSQFSQANENEKVNRQGLGLGLSIVKILVEKHNGAVQAESGGAGQGTTFTISLPLSVTENQAAPENQLSSNDQPLQNIKILLVEDDTDSREVMELFLTQSGAVVESAKSADDALEILTARENTLPDVIVSDLAMPGEDGYSLISRIRRLQENKGGKVPAIALSAFASIENKQKAFEKGFQKYTTKPFDPDLLVSEILDLLV